ncbi:MAG: DUF4145 domain-containing protein [Candidatus Thorarchaeota archaeon]
MQKGRKGEAENVAGFCPKCNAYAVFNVIGKYYPPGEWDEADYVFEHVFASCTNCRMPALLTRFILVYEENPTGSFRTEFPKSREDSRDFRFEVPREIQVSYDEAIRCERGKAWNACAVMVGRALEAVCKDFDARIRNIHSGLKKMHDQGIISTELFEWANELRLIRNIGAHASGVDVDKEDARESLDFLQAILETIYHLRPMFAKMKERRGAAGKS